MKTLAFIGVINVSIIQKPGVFFRVANIKENTLHKFLCVTLLLASINAFAQDKCPSELELQNDKRPHSEKLTQFALCLQRKIEKIEQQTLTAPYKVCTTWVYQNWRDSIVVPKSWDRDNCLGYARNVGGHSYAIGCMFNNGIEFGAEVNLREGNPPRAQPPANSNCGW